MRPPTHPAQDGATFVHVHKWTDGRGGWLSSVGVLLAEPPAPGAPPGAPPRVANALLGATNASLVPGLLARAGAASRAPLLVYIDANATLGGAPPLPPAGVAIGRPVVLVGLQSLPTSIDLGMAVNQLNETGSPYGNVTFVGLALENTAPGDAATATVAGPFSIAISNNLWAAYYNRCAAGPALSSGSRRLGTNGVDAGPRLPPPGCHMPSSHTEPRTPQPCPNPRHPRSVPNSVRLALFNVTMVLPSESEMAYVTVGRQRGGCWALRRC
jgi:hypothetical protein